MNSKHSLNGHNSHMKIAVIIFSFPTEEKILEEKWSPDAVVGYAKRRKKFEYVPSTKTLSTYWKRFLSTKQILIEAYYDI